MTREEFHQAFNELANAFPLSRIGEAVEPNWYKRFQPYTAFRVKAAFQLLAMEERFPTMGSALALTKDMGTAGIRYVVPEFGFCHKDILGEGNVRCGCANCKPEYYEAHAKRYKEIYDRWPWEREKGKWEKLADECAADPGGREGFMKFVGMLKSSKHGSELGRIVEQGLKP
jgi:hypothetical protein